MCVRVIVVTDSYKVLCLLIIPFHHVLCTRLALIRAGMGSSACTIVAYRAAFCVCVCIRVCACVINECLWVCV